MHVETHAPAVAPGVRELTLEGFRNYETLHTDLSPGLNVLIGANAQGKTNFLEALYLLSTTRLLRGMRDAEAVKEGVQRAIVKAELQHSHTSLSVILERGIRKRAQINGVSLPRASDLIGRLPSVCISSADLPIVREEPSDRRLFLDLEISQLFPAYLRHLTQYKRALEQRNALLKASQEFSRAIEEFEPWEAQMSEHGAALREQRAIFVESLLPIARGLHGRMGDGETLSLRYEPKDPANTPEELLRAMEMARHGEIGRGSSNIGPHRDDLLIEVGGREARLYGSQGQQRTAIICLKLAVLEFAELELGQPPMLLLDDILSDLDEKRRAMLIEIVLARTGQAVLTCTEASAAGEDILKRAKVFSVEKGTVSEA